MTPRFVRRMREEVSILDAVSGRTLGAREKPFTCLAIRSPYLSVMAATHAR